MPQAQKTTHRPELVFALVGAAGTRLDDLSRALKERLAHFNYICDDIHLSSLLERFPWENQQKPTAACERVKYLQDKGDAFRLRLQDGAALTRAAVEAIREKRITITGNPETPAIAHAYILDQLKHPDEVDLLRQIYGTSFYLIAGHEPRETCITELAKRLARKDNQPGREWDYRERATGIVRRDEKQGSEYGQNTRDTYPKADLFANLSDPAGQFEVNRFVDLLFGHPFHTPLPDECAMYLASAASLRSSDDNRQVGAVIARLTRSADGKVKNVDVIATGMNEVPRGGGGFYWHRDSPDARDQWLICYLNQDRARDIKLSALAELIDTMKEMDWFDKVSGSSSNDLANELLGELKGTQFMEIGEFSRPVHAEMSALIDSARRGVAVDGQTMYVTTFPCHNCAKHIIAAGLHRVVYLEPYPKSRATDLYGEEIVLDPVDGREVPGKLVFCAFSGIAPQQYRRLFSMSERGAKRGRPLAQWNAEPHVLSPLYIPQNAALLYLAAECQALEKLPTDVYQWDVARVCPKLEAEKSGRSP